MRLIVALAMVALLAGCGSVAKVASTVYTPGPDKTGLAVKGYCGTLSEDLRTSFRGALNHHADPHDAYIWCAGEPPPWIGSDRWAAWQADHSQPNSQEE